MEESLEVCHPNKTTNLQGMGLALRPECWALKKWSVKVSWLTVIRLFTFKCCWISVLKTSVSRSQLGLVFFGALQMNQISFTCKTEEGPSLGPSGVRPGFSKWSKTSKTFWEFTCHPCAEKHPLLSSRIVRVSTHKKEEHWIWNLQVHDGFKPVDFCLLLHLLNRGWP